MKSDRILPAFPSKRSAIDSYAETSFPFLSFPDPYFVGSSSSVRAKLEPRGVISNADVRGLFFLELSCVDLRFPTGEKQLETETLLEKLFVVL